MNFSKTIGSKALSATLVVASLLLVSVALPVAYAGNPNPKKPVILACGATITKSTLLGSDITCTTDIPGLIVGKNGITLNCNGFTITNTLGPSNPSINPSAGSHQAGIQVAMFGGVTVKNCHVTGFAVGIGLASSSGDTITNNDAHGNALGIALQGSSTNLLTSNTANSNNNDGFLIQCDPSGCATGPSAGNTVNSNTADSNGISPFGGFGYHDRTIGAGTSGTANNYGTDTCLSNLSGGSSPTGLCTPQP